MQHTVLSDLIDLFMPLFVVILAIIITILLVRLVFFIMLKVMSFIPVDAIKNKFETTPKYYKKEEDELIRDKKKEKKKELDNTKQNLNPRFNQNLNPNLKPFRYAQTSLSEKKVVGFFTKMVLGNNMSQIYTQARSNGNFWQNLIQSQHQGRSNNNGRGF